MFKSKFIKCLTIATIGALMICQVTASAKTSASNSSEKEVTATNSAEKFKTGQTIQGITIESVDEQGRPTKVKYDVNSGLTPEKVDKILNIPIKNYLKNPPKFIRYTYENAPADIKAQHEAKAKAVNAKISPSDEILVPYASSSSVNSTLNSLSVEAAPYTSSSSVQVIPYGVSCDSQGNLTASVGYITDYYHVEYYYANKYTDMIGYGHITSGNKVKCAQTGLSTYYFASTGTTHVITIDGLFGNETYSAVLNVQEDAGISQDGVVGPITWSAISD